MTPSALFRCVTILLGGLLAGCANLAGRSATGMSYIGVALPPAVDVRVPTFATKPYESFARDDAVAIAVREWRLFGMLIDDDPPGTRPKPAPDAKPERTPGLWQRVGEYWWLGQNPDLPEGDWTGKQDEFGRVFPAGEDGTYAWSAAFISYVMRLAGAGRRFVYSPAHADYINAARQGFGVATAEPPTLYAPQLGDLICLGRGHAAGMTFADLPAPRFPAHCDMVVGLAGQAPAGAAALAGQLAVIGGNVDDAVTLKHVPVTADGMLADADGVVLDGRYPWFVVLRIAYDQVVSAVPARDKVGF